MANSFSCMYVHIVWATKRRGWQIAAPLKDEVEKLLVGTAQEYGLVPIATFAMPDHVHMLVRSTAAILLSDVIGRIKSRTARCMNEKYGKVLRWQTGYGAFSVSKSIVPRVKRYIHNQEEHHKKFLFSEEYLEWLNAYQIEYDIKYVFDE